MHVFEWSGSRWTEVQELPLPAGVSALGQPSMAIEGDRAVVGGSDGSVWRAWVYERSGRVWSLTATLLPNLFHQQQLLVALVDLDFGRRVALSGDRIAVAAPVGFWPFSLEGAVFGFELGAGGWQEVAWLRADDGHRFDRFGAGLALDGDRLVVGAPATHAPPPALSGGKVYVFERGPAGWIQVARLTEPLAPQIPHQFGSAVAQSAGRIFVGDRGGALAFVYEDTSDGWVRTAVLRLPVADSALGDALSRGHLLLVGAPYFAPGGGGTARTGAAFLYRFDGDSWAQIAEMTPTNGVGFAGFGRVLHLSTDFILVGAGNVGVGAAYSFAARGPLGEVWCGSVQNSTGAPGALRASGCSNVVFVDVTFEVSRLPASAYGVMLAAPGWDLVLDFGGGQGALCLAQPPALLALFQADSSGRATVPLDFTSLPPGVGFAPGDAWYFQAWYRDANPGPTTNLSSSLEVGFR